MVKKDYQNKSISHYHLCGNLLQTLRKKAHLTQAEMALEVESNLEMEHARSITNKTISHWENDVLPIKLHDLHVIISILYKRGALQTREEADRLLREADYRALKDEEYLKIFRYFVGRESHIEKLENHLNEALDGHGQVMFITGPAGEGKTTLIKEFRARCEKLHPELRFAVGECDTVTSAYLPFRTILEQLLQNQQRVSQLLTGEYPHKQFAELLTEQADSYPMILVLEDLHLADEGSIDMLSNLGEYIRRCRILVVGTYRSSEAPQTLRKLESKFRHFFRDPVMQLDSPNGEYGLYFVNALLDWFPNKLGATFRQKLYEYTAGNALFTTEWIQEMMRNQSIQQDADGAWVEGSTLNWQTMPNKVEYVLQRRIGRLPETLHKLLQAASIEGEMFTTEIIAQTLNLGEDQVANQCRDLEKKFGLVHDQGVQDWGGNRFHKYKFRHLVFQKFLYDSLDKRERQDFHESIGLAIETSYAHSLENSEKVVHLAKHFKQANHMSKAITYFHLSGKRAMHYSAHGEAIRHIEHGLALLPALEGYDKKYRRQQELDFLLLRSQVLMVSYGYAAQIVKDCFTRVVTLCQDMNWQVPFDTRQGLWVGYLVRAELNEALQIAKVMHSQAIETKNSELTLMSYGNLGMTYFHLGNQVQARKYLDAAIALCSDAHYEPPTENTLDHHGVIPIVNLLAYNQHAAWLLGDVDEAMQMSRRSIEIADRKNHAYSKDYALSLAAILHFLRRERSDTRTTVVAALEISEEYGFIQWNAHETVIYGWLLAQEGRSQEGLAKIEDGIERWLSTGAKLGLAIYYYMWAEAHYKAGQVVEALQKIEAAATHGEEHSESWYLSEIYRLKGSFLLKQGNIEGEKFLNKALVMARSNQLKTLEHTIAASIQIEK